MTAAVTPAIGPSTRRPRQNVNHTRSAAKMGTTMYGPILPIVMMASAIMNGSPDAYVGTIVWGDCPDLYPSGICIWSPEGNGSDSRSGYGCGSGPRTQP